MRQGVAPPAPAAVELAVGLEGVLREAVKKAEEVALSGISVMLPLVAGFRDGKSTALAYLEYTLPLALAEKGVRAAVGRISLAQFKDIQTVSWRLIYRDLLRSLSGSDEGAIGVWEEIASRAYDAFDGDVRDFMRFCEEIFGSRAVGRHLLSVLSGRPEDAYAARMKLTSILRMEGFALFEREVDAYNALVRLLKWMTERYGVTVILMDELDTLLTVEPRSREDFLEKLIQLVEAKELRILLMPAATPDFMVRVAREYPRRGRWLEFRPSLPRLRRDELEELFQKIKKFYAKAYPESRRVIERIKLAGDFLRAVESASTKGEQVQLMAAEIEKAIREGPALPPLRSSGEIVREILNQIKMERETTLRRLDERRKGKIFEEGLHRVFRAMERRGLLSEVRREYRIEELGLREKILDFVVRIDSTSVGIQVATSWSSGRIPISEVRPLVFSVGAEIVEKALLIANREFLERGLTTGNKGAAAAVKGLLAEKPGTFGALGFDREPLEVTVGIGLLRASLERDLVEHDDPRVFEEVIGERVLRPTGMLPILRSLCEGRLVIDVNTRTGKVQQRVIGPLA